MTNIEPAAPRLPTAAEEERLWSLLEQAWSGETDGVNAARRALTHRTPGDDGEADHQVADGALESFLRRLTVLCADFSTEDLTALDRVLERKLYDLDRDDIHEVTDGSDDGFLYARGFIVALGRDFHTAVVREPRLAILDAECEEMCYFFAHLHDDRFGGYPETGSGISRESGFNRHGWAATGAG